MVLGSRFHEVYAPFSFALESEALVGFKVVEVEEGEEEG